MRPNCFAGLLLPSLLASSALPAQVSQPLELELRGGSIPGVIDLDCHPGQIFQFAFLLMGFSNAPATPLSLVDPADSRVVQIALPQMQLFFGSFDLAQHLTFGFNVPPLPSLADAPVYFACVSLGGITTLADQVSPTRAVHLAPAGAFRDRGVFAAEERSFARMLPRADGRWMIVGGGSGALFAQIARQDCEIYDDVADAFVAGPVMVQHRSLHTATQLPDGRWFLVGGVNAINDPQVECEIYDPATDAFTATAPMTTPRIGHSATLLPNGRVLVAGGLTVVTLIPTPLATLFSATATTEIYDPVTDTWAPGPSLLTPRAAHLAIPRPDGRLVLAGGLSFDALPTIRSSTDLYDPVLNAIAAGPTMATERALIDPIDLGGGRWLCAGGLDLSGASGNTAEIYDSASNTFVAAAGMASARANHAAVALGGGRFLVVGGASGTLLLPTPLGSCEIFDDNTGLWSPGPPLNTARTGFAAIVTPRGQLQVTSGGTSGGMLTRSSEWYYF